MIWKSPAIVLVGCYPFSHINYFNLVFHKMKTFENFDIEIYLSQSSYVYVTLVEQGALYCHELWINWLSSTVAWLIRITYSMDIMSFCPSHGNQQIRYDSFVLDPNDDKVGKLLKVCDASNEDKLILLDILWACSWSWALDSFQMLRWGKVSTETICC